jgi:predicted CoA-binding protein
MTTQAAVDAFLSHKTIAIVGVSRHGGKFGNYAMRTLQAKGYTVVPVHPAASEIDGVTCVPRIAKLPGNVRAVLIVLPHAQTLAVVREAADAGIRDVWVQQGAESPAVVALCKELGLHAVTGECILMFANATGFHKLHRWIWRIAGRLPRAASA